MGKNQGNNKKPVDMGIYPVATKNDYFPHPDSVEETHTLDMDNGLIFRAVTRHYPHNEVVWFTLLLFYEKESDDTQIARYDCRHNSIHKHLFTKDRREIVCRHPIYSLDPDNFPEHTVNKFYWECYDRFMDEVEENYRRWGND